MSGYLSRIVQTAARSSQPLRPLAGSVFGSPAEQTQTSHLNNAPFVVEAEIPAIASDTSAHQHRAARIPTSPAPESFLENYQPLQPGQQPIQQPIQQPRQDIRAPFNSPVMPAQSRSLATESNQARSNQHSAEDVRALALRADSIAPQTPDNHAFAPTIASKTEEPQDQSASRLAQSRPATEGINQKPQKVEPISNAQPTSKNPTVPVASQTLIPAQRSQMARPQQQPMRDQRPQPAPEPHIEIHIGRIEVLAVQPPAAAAPAPRRDRSTSLADYLAGQNGRRS